MTHLRTNNKTYSYNNYWGNPADLLDTWFNDPFFLGFHNQFNRWGTIERSSFPPYNVKKINEDTYTVELALAGYDRNDIDVTVDKDTLIIKSSNENTSESDFIHKGIAGRKFTQNFTLGEYMEVKSAAFENGLLTIKIEREIPEDQKPRQIKIK
jgi:molecular chaperone IbpA